MSRRQDRLRPRGEAGREPSRTRGVRQMPKYLLLKHYTGGPEPLHHPPMGEWTPDEISAHMAFQHQVSAMLTERGEFVDAQALSPEGAWVQYGGPDAAPVVTDG